MKRIPSQLGLFLAFVLVVAGCGPSGRFKATLKSLQDLSAAIEAKVDRGEYRRLLAVAMAEAGRMDAADRKWALARDAVESFRMVDEIWIYRNGGSQVMFSDNPSWARMTNRFPDLVLLLRDDDVHIGSGRKRVSYTSIFRAAEFKAHNDTYKFRFY